MEFMENGISKWMGPTLVPEVLLHSEVLKVRMSGEIITACSLICAFGASKE